MTVAGSCSLRPARQYSYSNYLHRSLTQSPQVATHIYQSWLSAPSNNQTRPDHAHQPWRSNRQVLHQTLAGRTSIPLIPYQTRGTCWHLPTHNPSLLGRCGIRLLKDLPDVGISQDVQAHHPLSSAHASPWSSDQSTNLRPHRQSASYSVE